VRPQYLWIKPAPQLATAEAVRRWPALGPAGASQDSVILRLKGEPLPRSLLERSWRVVFYWRLTNAESQSWNLAQQAGQQSKPVSVPDFVATAGPWDIDLTASCPSEFRGLIELMPVLVSRSGFGTLTDTRAKLPIAPISSKKPPSGSQMGNAVLAETSGTTPGETPSPYRQVESLNANVPIARFRRTLGPESSWNYLPGGREYLFLAPEYCVQAVTDTKGLVLMYAVTTLI